MKYGVIWSVVVLAAVGTACSKGGQQPPQPAGTSGTPETGKAVQPLPGAKREGPPHEGPPKEITLDLGRGVTMQLVLIPAGQFMMGDEQGEGWAKPVHKVTISRPFYLGKYEVTQEQWEAVTGDKPSVFQGPKNPVELVSWQDVQDFIAKLNENFPAPGAKFSLPTEAQWEYACRAGTTTRYSFGDDPAPLGDYAWWAKNAAETTHPVGQKKPNAWGLYDVLGNVSEWCADWFAEDYYRRSPAKDPAGPDSGDSRVLRGGSWHNDAPDPFRCAYRDSSAPDARHDGAGFRIARTLTP